MCRKLCNAPTKISLLDPCPSSFNGTFYSPFAKIIFPEDSVLVSRINLLEFLSFAKTSCAIHLSMSSHTANPLETISHKS